MFHQKRIAPTLLVLVVAFVVSMTDTSIGQSYEIKIRQSLNYKLGVDVGNIGYSTGDIGSYSTSSTPQVEIPSDRFWDESQEATWIRYHDYSSSPQVQTQWEFIRDECQGYSATWSQAPMTELVTLPLYHCSPSTPQVEIQPDRFWDEYQEATWACTPMTELETFPHYNGYLSDHQSNVDLYTNFPKQHQPLVSGQLAQEAAKRKERERRLKQIPDNLDKTHSNQIGVVHSRLKTTMDDSFTSDLLPLAF